MDNEQEQQQQHQRRKGKRILFRPTRFLLSLTFITVCLSSLLLVSNRWLVHEGSFRPVLKVPTLSSFLPTLVTRDPFIAMSSPFAVEDSVLFPDHLLLILSNNIIISTNSTQDLECVYYKLNNISSSDDNTLDRVVFRPALSVDEYQEYKSVVRCQLPPCNYSDVVKLRRSGDLTVEVDSLADQTAVVPSWDGVVYDAMLDWNTAVVFVKGFNLVPGMGVDPKQFRCHFGLSKRFNKDGEFVFTTEATAAAQEVMRCLLPRSIRNNGKEKAEGIRVTVSRVNANATDAPLPSVAKIYSHRLYEQQGRMKKYELCACTMIRNQAMFLREWIMYHAWLGVERWFIYDNNSDDGVQEVIGKLNLENYNISRYVWPWMKAQEAGFSHCALRARRECKWLAFFDVDEFFFFPTRRRGKKGPAQNSLRALVRGYSNSPVYAEIRTTCYNYGPSGLTAVPPQGVTVGYTCRLKKSGWHKSIVRPDLLTITLLNTVHDFTLREGYKFLNVPVTTAVVNHYKYQVWETFKAKYFGRVSTYVINWKDQQNEKSKDNAAGLGAKAIEPPKWRLRFCEVWDTGLKDFVLANFADPVTGLLPWETSRSR